MSRIPSIFAALRAGNRPALMPFVCGGHPGPDSLPGILAALERGGALIVEIGIPFSDPIADGPVIAAAMHEALAAGVTPMRIFDQVASVRDSLRIGLVAMCSISIIHRMAGAAGFCRQAAAAGFNGLIVPDAPLEESREIIPAAAAHGLTCSLLVAPTTPPERIARLAAASTGFLYLLARTGITGERDEAPDVGGLVRQVRRATDLPIACGFGISTPEHVRAVVGDGGKGKDGADAAIVGSAMVRRLSKACAAGQDPATEAERFCRELAAGLQR